MPDQRQSSKQAAQNILSLNVGSCTARCFLPENGKTDSIIYMHAAMPDEADKVWQLLSCKCVLVCIGGIDWNRDMTPWYHPKVFAGGEDFGGGAGPYLEKLCDEIVPAVEQKTNSNIMADFSEKPRRFLIGYSLGGLFALYALYHTALFEGAASMSGSLWYDGWIQYMQDHQMYRKPEKIYLSLGDQEAKGNSVMRTVADCTVKTRDMLEAMGIRTKLEYNPGNHFKEVPLRIAKGIEWLERHDK